MRKTLVLLIFSCLSIHAMAQAQVSLGLKAGVNMSKIDGDGLEADNITSFNGGAFALVKLTKIGIQPEILFSKQGAKVDDSDIDLSYVNIPVMIKLYLAAGVNLQAGPQFGLLMSAKQEGEDIKELVKKSDLSASFGLGWDAPFGLIFDARYNLGLSDINDSAGIDGGIEGALKNRVIQISIGYKFIKFGK